MTTLSLLLRPARVIGRSTIQRDATRRMIAGANVPAISVRSYSTGTGARPPGPSLSELIGNTVSFLWEYLSPAASPQAAVPVTPASVPVPAPAEPAGPRKEPSGRPADPWAGEAAWVAVDKDGIKCRPGHYERLYRSHQVAPEVLFRDGMPAPGGDFSLKAHQKRTGEREGTGDAFYGACHVMVWGENEGPAFDMGNRYMSVLKDAYGYAMANQLGTISIAEMETVVHMVPPHKIVAVLDKLTGDIHLNPANPKDLSVELTGQLTKIWNIGLDRGVYEKPAHS
ncbi:hypothetical protein ACLQ2R_22170 [Streptosporangium sp. DT93]|uniref:hypothetical protein n=1 Tax=Streptosporangium sp. DT93 TaxID=3393428 RepID=UPI003CFABEDD